MGGWQRGREGGRVGGWVGGWKGGREEGEREGRREGGWKEKVICLMYQSLSERTEAHQHSECPHVVFVFLSVQCAS